MLRWKAFLKLEEDHVQFWRGLEVYKQKFVKTSMRKGQTDTQSERFSVPQVHLMDKTAKVNRKRILNIRVEN